MKVINGMKMYDTQETAKLFNISSATLTNLRSRGLIRSVQIGRKKFTSEETIKEYLNGLIVPPPKPQPEKGKLNTK